MRQDPDNISCWAEWHTLTIFIMFLLTSSLPGGGSFAKELHETALHHQPEAARHVKYDGKEDEVQGDPLVIGVVHYCVITVILKESNELLKRKICRELKRIGWIQRKQQHIDMLSFLLFIFHLDS